MIIDCGGGVVLDPENITNLKKNGTLIYLSASAESIWQRVKGRKHRPLLNVEDPQAKIKELLESRKSFYEQADHVVDTNNKTINAVCDEIGRLLGND